MLCLSSIVGWSFGFGHSLFLSLCVWTFTDTSRLWDSLGKGHGANLLGARLLRPVWVLVVWVLCLLDNLLCLDHPFESKGGLYHDVCRAAHASDRLWVCLSDGHHSGRQGVHQPWSTNVLDWQKPYDMHSGSRLCTGRWLYRVWPVGNRLPQLHLYLCHLCMSLDCDMDGFCATAQGKKVHLWRTDTIEYIVV